MHEKNFLNRKVKAYGKKISTDFHSKKNAGKKLSLCQFGNNSAPWMKVMMSLSKEALLNKMFRKYFHFNNY